jgi:hypothetical protein
MQGDYEQIIRIERIQNPALYLQFIDRKKKMDKVNPKGHQNERSLFHGAAVDTCPKINQNGFNRSFAGKNGNNNDAIIIVMIMLIYYTIYCFQLLHMVKVCILQEIPAFLHKVSTLQVTQTVVNICTLSELSLECLPRETAQ